MLSAPHLPLALFPRAGAPPGVAVHEPSGPGTAWLRAPERAETLGEARVLGESLEAARILGQTLRSGTVTGEDGIRLREAVVLCGEGHCGLQWMAGELPLTVLDPRRGDDLGAVLLRLKGRWREAAVVVIATGPEDPVPSLRVEVAAAQRDAGLSDRGRWFAFAPPGPVWGSSVRWRSRIALPSWLLGAQLPTSPAGVFFAEWGGRDSVRLAAGAREVDDWCAEPVPHQNPAAWLAADLVGPVSLFSTRSALAPAAQWASSAAASRGRVIVCADPAAAPGWSRWTLTGPEGNGPVGAMEIRLDVDDPAAWGAWCALVERALDLADLAKQPPWYGAAAEAP